MSPSPQLLAPEALTTFGLVAIIRRSDVTMGFPGKLLAHNCSPSFNWQLNLDDKAMATFQEKLAELGYRFQFVTLAGFHTLNMSMFELANAYRAQGMLAYSMLVQEREFELEKEYGYRAVKHQSLVGAGYFDEIQMAVTGEGVSTTALKGSTEEEQFTSEPARVH